MGKDGALHDSWPPDAQPLHHVKGVGPATASKLSREACAVATSGPPGRPPVDYDTSMVRSDRTPLRVHIKHFRHIYRVFIVTATTAFPLGDALERLTATLAHAASWAAVGSILGLMVIAGVIRLLTEWQRRLTIVAIVERAPEGTVVIQGCVPGRPGLWLLVGHGSPGTVLRQPPTLRPGDR